MKQATNVTISKVYEGKSGTSEGKNGPFDWTAYSVYFEGSENKYGYFVSGRKPIPRVGMKISYLEFDVKQNGQHTNRTITKLVLDENTPQTHKDAPQSQNGNKAYIDHGKCVIRLMEIADFDENRLHDLIVMFADGINQVVVELNGSHDKKEPDYDPEEPPMPLEEDIPF